MPAEWQGDTIAIPLGWQVPQSGIYIFEVYAPDEYHLHQWVWDTFYYVDANGAHEDRRPKPKVYGPTDPGGYESKDPVGDPDQGEVEGYGAGHAQRNADGTISFADMPGVSSCVAGVRKLAKYRIQMHDKDEKVVAEIEFEIYIDTTNGQDVHFFMPTKGIPGAKNPSQEPAPQKPAEQKPPEEKPPEAK